MQHTRRPIARRPPRQLPRHMRRSRTERQPVPVMPTGSATAVEPPATSLGNGATAMPADGTSLLTASVRMPGWPRALIDAAATLRAHAGVLIVIAAFMATWAVVPIFTPTPVGDDWVYSISVNDLLQHGKLNILPLSVTTLVFQVLWGALFGLVFGDTFGAHRFSTVVIFLLSGIAFYWLLCTLGVSRARSALGAAVYLFNPLSFVLAFSFMTDPHYLAVMVISLAFYASGLRGDRVNRTHILIGSFFAGCAFLVRQQGALIPFGVIVYLLLTRQLWFNWRSVRRFLEIVAIPVVMLVVYYLWIFLIAGVPDQQDQFLQQALSAGVGGTWLLLRRMTWFEVMTVGFFVLPITVAALAGLVPITRDALRVRLGRKRSLSTAVRLLAFAGWLLIAVLGFIVFYRANWLAPYLSQFVSMTGLGPNDLLGGRGNVLSPSSTQSLQKVMTWLELGSAVIFGAATIGQIGSRATPTRGIAAMLFIVGLGQVAGVMPPSFHFRDWIVSVDRYLLPLLPFAIALLLWSLRNVRIATAAGWVVIAGLAAFSVVGTRDFLTFQKATWDYARYVNYDLGIPLTRIDGGTSWDGYYLYTYSLNNHIPQQTVAGPWWTNLFAPATDSTYVISGSPTAPADGTYVQIGQREYSSWLHASPTYLYLMQRVVLPAGAAPAQPVPSGTAPPPVYARPAS